MKNMRKIGLVLAMEENEEDLVGGTEAEVPEAIVEVEESVAEVSDDVGEIEEIHAAIEEAEAGAETLGAIQDVMQDSVDQGEGLDETASQLAEVSVEAICTKLGFRAGTRYLPATESFRGKNSRVVTTQIAIEGIGATIKKIWESIKKGFLTVWEKIKAFFQTYFTALGRVKNLCESLKVKVKDFKEEGTAEPIKTAALVSAFSVEGKAGFEQAKEILQNHAKYTQSLLKAKDALLDAAKTIEAGVKDFASFNPETLKSSADAYVSAVGADSGILVGGTNITTKVEETDLKTAVIKIISGTASKPADEMPALKKTEMGTIIAGVIALISRAEEFKREEAKFEAVNKAIIKVADVVISSADKIATKSEESAEAKKGENAAKQAMNSLKTVLNQTTTMVPSLNVRAAQAALKYVDASLKAYKPAEAAKPEETAAAA